MAKSAAGALLVVALFFLPAASHAARGGHGGGHGSWHGGGGWHGGAWHGGVFIGGPWWWGPPYYYSPYWYRYYPPPYPPYPPPVVEGPQVYIQQPKEPSEAAVPGYWYYCASAKAYYPTVQTCPEDWIKVPPVPR
jgi:hypothetical protein